MNSLALIFDLLARDKASPSASGGAAMRTAVEGIRRVVYRRPIAPPCSHAQSFDAVVDAVTIADALDRWRRQR